ncbi:MAG: sulfotransferase [Fuerstiella sp.]
MPRQLLETGDGLISSGSSQSLLEDGPKPSSQSPSQSPFQGIKSQVTESQSTTSTMASQKSKTRLVRNSQGGFMLWHGMKLSGLARFLKTKPPIHWTRLHRLLSLPPAAAMNSVLAAAESAVYGRAVQRTEVKQDPLFVFGYWRSGTTLLQTLLSHDSRFQHLGLFRAMFPWHFLLTEKLITPWTGWALPKGRPMDNMKVTWDAPQEDDLALCVMSQISPSLVTAHPSNPKYFWDAIDFNRLPEQDVQRWRDSLKLLVRKMTYSCDKQVLMKSPFHMYHIPLLREMFPNSKFIYIHRNPYDVWRSSLHLRRRTIEENCLGKKPFENAGHEEELIKSMKFGFDVYERDRMDLPDDCLHEVRYEDLTSNPIETLRATYDQLGLGQFDALETSLQPELEAMKNYKKNQFTDDPVWVNRVYDELRPLFDRFDYQKPGSSDPASATPNQSSRSPK